MKTITSVIVPIISLCLWGASAGYAQYNSAKVFWVGHSLMDGKDWNNYNSKNLLDYMEILSSESGKQYDSKRHIIPGAPFGWNWGVTNSWAQVAPQIAPLTDQNHSDYGSFNAIVITEGVNVNSSYDAWSSGFYARKFFAAAKNANPQTRLFLYESWHHYNAGDFRAYYGPQASFNWKNYMLNARLTWEKIADEAADPAVLALGNNPDNYVYVGYGTDPGISNETFTVNIIPSGQVLVKVLDRIAENRFSDNWTLSSAAKNGKLSDVDFFMNPLLNFPSDLTTTVHGGELDDIHASEILSYLNALTHYAVIYGQNPQGLPSTEFITPAIAQIFQEVVWDVVTNDPRTGVKAQSTLVRQKPITPNYIRAKLYTLKGQKIN